MQADDCRARVIGRAAAAPRELTNFVPLIMHHQTRFPLLLTSVLLVLVAHGQQQLPADSLLADLQLYRQTLEQKHVHPFTAESHAAFNAAADRMGTEIGTYSPERFLVELMRLNTLVNDEHTLVWAKSRWQLPYRFLQCEEGMVVSHTDSGHTAQAMHRLLAINERPFDVIADRISSLIKQDNPSFVIAAMGWLIEEPEVLMGLGIIDRYDAIPFTFESPTRDTVRTVVAARPIDAPLSWVRAEALGRMMAHTESGIYWYKDDPSTRTLYVQYSQCAEDPEHPFKDFNKQLFTHIKATKPDRLVLDLRSNGGGNSSILSPFIKKIRGSYLNADGRFSILIGPGVFSSALMNAVELKRTTKATLVGQMTGANVNQFGEVKSLTLPRTGIRMTWSTKYWENWRGKNGGLEPDVVMPITWADLQQGLDRSYAVASGFAVGPTRSVPHP